MKRVAVCLKALFMVALFFQVNIAFAQDEDSKSGTGSVDEKEMKKISETVEELAKANKLILKKLESCNAEEKGKEAGNNPKEKVETAGKKSEENNSKNITLGTQMPWNGLLLKLSDEEKRGILSLSFPFLDALNFSTTISVPLDEKTRQANILSNKNVSPGFEGNFVLEYYSGYASLEKERTNLESIYRKEYCKMKPKLGTTCDKSSLSNDKEYKKWIAKKLPLMSMNSVYESNEKNTVEWLIGIDLAGAYDQFDVYDSEDINAGSRSEKTYTISLGMIGRLFLNQNFAISLRAGFTRIKRLETKAGKKCETLDSDNADTTGQTCNDILVVVSDPDAENAAYVEAAFTYVSSTDVGYLAPGLDLRFRTDELFSDKSVGDNLKISLTAFLTPLKSPVITRFGVGVERNYKDNIYPFIMIGGGI